MSNNMKSWADEQDDSSDEDDDDDDDALLIPPSGFPSSSSSSSGIHASNTNDKNLVEAAKAVVVQDDHSPHPFQREFILPSQPPYTAYLGNLPYDIRDSNDLGREVEAMLRERQCALARRVTNARLIMEKRHNTNTNNSNSSGSGSSRGYGYVEFETDGELMEFLRLPNPRLCGRNIKVDVAHGPPRTSSARVGGGGSGRGGGARDGIGSSKGSDGRDGRGRGGSSTSSSITSGGRQYSDQSVGGGKVDGSQFMGGRYAGGRSNSGNNSSAAPSGGGRTTPTAVMRRADSSASHGTTRDAEDAAPVDAATKQRPSLKLLARTKPLENASSSTATGTQSSIFGGAKPRDESKFVPAAAEAAVETKNVAADDSRKDVVTLGVAEMEISKSDATGPVSDVAIGDSKSVDNNDGGEATEAPAPPAPETNDKAPSKNSYERKDSRGGGGRGGGGRGRGGNRNRENEDGKREGRRDSSHKSGRGERGAGGRGRGGSEGRGEGRNSNNERRNSRSTKNGSTTVSGKSNAESSKGKSGGVSSLAAAAAAAGEVVPKSLPTMPMAKETKKGQPKKDNSFAALVDDDSDSD